jgi:hypothetical protein
MDPTLRQILVDLYAKDLALVQRDRRIRELEERIATLESQGAIAPRVSEPEP